MGAVVTVLDATHRRLAQEEMLTAAKRRDHFLAMLSHELRNPLAAVLNATEVISLYDKGTTWEQLDAAKLVIARQSRHMARLLEDLLDVSRITRGKFPLRVEDLEVGDRMPGDGAVYPDDDLRAETTPAYNFVRKDGTPY